MKKNVSCCGINCNTCKYFGNLCDGCNQVRGEAFWTKFSDIPVCPLFDCCKNKRGLSHCGLCENIPCRLHYANIDPATSEDEHIEEVQARVEYLTAQTTKEIGKCGFLCGKCKAFRPNVMKNDQRIELQHVFKKYYNLDFSLEELMCDGCNCTRGDGHQLDSSCPIRPCVASKNIDNCGDCSKFPCEMFKQRQGLTCEAARAAAGCAFSQKEFDETLFVYDNLNNLK